MIIKDMLEYMKIHEHTQIAFDKRCEIANFRFRSLSKLPEKKTVLILKSLKQNY